MNSQGESVPMIWVWVDDFFVSIPTYEGNMWALSLLMSHLVSKGQLFSHKHKVKPPAQVTFCSFEHDVPPPFGCVTCLRNVNLAEQWVIETTAEDPPPLGFTT